MNIIVVVVIRSTVSFAKVAKKRNSYLIRGVNKLRFCQCSNWLQDV